jgi:sorting nexin-29
LERIHKLIKKIWEEEQMPTQRKTGLIYPIHKKGDKMLCENYRGITLLNVVYKILSTVLLKQINIYAEEIMGECQCGFRSDEVP